MMTRKSPNIHRGITKPRFTSLPAGVSIVVVDVVLYGVKSGFNQKGLSESVFMNIDKVLRSLSSFWFSWQLSYASIM